MTYLQRTEKILERINALAAISEMESGITRTFGTDAFIRGRELLLGWMKQAGLETGVDNIGNARGLLSNGNPKSRCLLIASHIDTVIEAGKFDGPLGVLLGLDLLENLFAQNTRLPFNIELAAFCDEEGVRFHTTYLGSQAVAGTFDTALLEKKDAGGTSLREVIQYAGGNAAALGMQLNEQKQWLGYFEVHIEQGPVLYEKDIPAAVVSSIAGQKRVEVVFTGTAGHAGTVPMNMREDALCCAAEFVLETEKLAHEHGIVATVGKLTMKNAASNVVPGEVLCTVDMRSEDKYLLTVFSDRLQDFLATLTRKRNIRCDWKLVQETAPVSCDAGMSALLSASINEAGYEAMQLVSGAGHDAVAISAVAPVCMLFVRCYKGISHNPLENVENKDIAAALKISETFIHHLIRRYNT